MCLNQIKIRTICPASSVALLLLTGSPVSGTEPEKLVTLPQTVVTAQKGPRDALDLPLSVTTIQLSPIATEDTHVKDLSSLVPGVFVNEFSARAVSNPFFRGIGGSPANPGVTTYIDGVPQLNAYSSSIELIDVAQVEFVRGPQGTLFGRNTPGGLVTITSNKPSNAWTGRAEAGYGNYAAKDLRAVVSGPLFPDELSMSLAGGFVEREGYTRNLFNGEDVDSKQALFGKAQLMLTSSEQFEARLLLTGERDRDGDYALGDLGELRAHPHEVTRDFTQGYNDRDALAPTLIAAWKGESLNIESTSGFVHWRNDSLTDLDYGVASPANYFLNATRKNKESQDQFTQEFRLSSPTDRPATLAEDLTLAWQSGVFLFYRDYDQATANSFAPPLSAISGTTDSDLTDYGAGVYGQASLEFAQRVQFALGARADVEAKEAELSTSATPTSNLDDTFSEISPQFGVSYKVTNGQRVYAAISRGYKAGGFNPPSVAPAPQGTESYHSEHSWNYEIGYKVREFDGKLEAALAAFYSHWDDLQLNQQYPGSTAQYYIGNAGSATTKGIEAELTWHPLSWLDLFANAATMDSRFLSGSKAFNANQGADQNVSGNWLPFAPKFTVAAGTEARWRVTRSLTLYASTRITATGKFYYDPSNAESQDSYSLAGFRTGVRADHWFVEGWIENAFGSEYIPIAIPYAQLGAPSGYIGESGAPRVFGIRAGLHF